MINDLVKSIHDKNVKAGWWNTADGGSVFDLPDDIKANFLAAKIALIHSEVSEALEGLRKGTIDDHLPHRLAVEVELADAIIRIFDLAGAMNLDVENALYEKLEYNSKRADHKLHNRNKEGGKKF